MATITIEEFKGTKRTTLTAPQGQMFVDEVRRVRGGWFNQLLARLTARAVRRYAIAPDCLVRVDHNGQITVYELHGRYFLKKSGDHYVRPFFMGLLLLEWLYA